MLVNRNSKNEQLLLDATVRTALESGNCILLDKAVTSNPDYTTLYIAGFVENTGSSTGVSDAQAQLLGWSENSFYVARCVQNAKTAVADKFVVGHVFPDFALQVVDHTKPQYAEHAPRQSKKGEIYMSEAGEKIYRTFVLTTKAELAEQGHKIIKRQTATAPAVSAKAAAMLEA